MTGLLIAIFLVATCLLLFQLRRLRQSGEVGAEELDLDAMASLLDESQSAFVQAHLSPAAYRRYERGNKRVLLAYLGGMSAFLANRIRALSALPARSRAEDEQLDLFLHSRQLIYRAQAMVWLSLLLPSQARIWQAGRHHCRQLFAELQGEQRLSAAS
jgi:hypothetical protein